MKTIDALSGRLENPIIALLLTWLLWLPGGRVLSAAVSRVAGAAGDAQQDRACVVAGAHARLGRALSDRARQHARASGGGAAAHRARAQQLLPAGACARV